MASSLYKVCVSPGCEADTDTECWEVAGINARGKVEWWCPQCAQQQEILLGSLAKARLEWASQGAQKTRLIAQAEGVSTGISMHHEEVSQSTLATEAPSESKQADSSSAEIPSRRMMHSSDDSEDGSQEVKSPPFVRRQQPKTAFSSSSSSFDDTELGKHRPREQLKRIMGPNIESRPLSFSDGSDDDLFLDPPPKSKISHNSPPKSLSKRQQALCQARERRSPSISAQAVDWSDSSDDGVPVQREPPAKAKARIDSLQTGIVDWYDSESE